MATNKKPLDSSNKIKTVPTVCSLRRAVSAEDTGEGDIRRLRESSLGVFERQESEVIVGHSRQLHTDSPCAAL